MLIKGKLKSIGSGTVNQVAKWGTVDSIDFYEDIPELRRITATSYLLEKLHANMGEEVEISLYKNIIIGVKAGNKTYSEALGFRSFVNSFGLFKTYALMLVGFVGVSTIILPVGAIAFYLNEMKTIKNTFKEDLGVTH
jgi:hypothetical protein